MPEAVPPEKMRYLDETRAKLRADAYNPRVYRSHQQLQIEWRGGSAGRTTINGIELICDERAESTGHGEGVSPAHTFLAGFGFAHMTQWGRAASRLGLTIDDLQEEIHASFDRRGEYLYEDGFPHPGFTDITFEVRITSGTATPEQTRAFAAWGERSPVHATLRRAVRLVGVYYLNGQHLTTAVYHSDRTEWR